MVSHLLNNLAGSLEKRPQATPDELGEALGLLTESLAVQRTVGDVSLTAHALLLSGHVLTSQGATSAAGERYESCLRLSRESGDRWALMRWARERMAAYKVPRVVQFADALPKSGTGKVMWRALQEAENAAP